ncbi:MAG: UDP-N-acetylmuramoyl-tripeptide--D-alanyl-D-alanine ligase [Oscillospiraceae bacterium]|nr:UDP-N-acetylmuramoyl-tripeptide--D-alanyl-D-alanine ligase [Oscillospiraceae bacterium]
MEKLYLSEIADCLGADCPKECEITEISTDTRNLPQGCLFLAIKGERFDGHEYIEKAIETGAVAAVSEHQVGDCPCVVTDSTRMALLKIAQYYRQKFSPILVGVTGSVGKTTTKEMISLVLSEKYSTLKTQGNLNNEIGLPKTLFNLTSEHKAAVIEMGMNHFGEIERLTNTARPTMAVITNIGFSHVENLGSQEGILKAKLEILSSMNSNSPLITNGDDKFLSPLKNTLDRPVYLYGIENENCDFRAVNISEKDSETAFDIVWKDGKISAVIPCVGIHNVMNAVAAFAVGTLSGLTAEEIVSALKKYTPDGMRQNIVKKGKNTVIIDCYNASPDSMKASLSVLAGMKCEGRKIAVLGDMLELGKSSEELHRLVGKYVAEYKPDLLYCYGKDSSYIAAEASRGGVAGSFFHEGDKEFMAEKIKEKLQSGDVLLFKASRGMRLEEAIDKIFE